MGTIHVCICHNNNLVIAKLGNVKVIAIALGKPAAKGINHGLDLRVGKNLVNTGLFHVQDLSPNGKDRLKLPVSGGFGAAAGGIPLHDEDLAFCRIPGFAVGQLSVGVKGKLLLGQHIGPGPLLGLADLRGLFGTGNNIF